MLRNSYLLKYSKKLKTTEFDEQILKEDGEYILNNNRPLSQYKISRLPKKKLFSFMEDFLTNKKVTRLLYTTNAEKEINHFLHSTQVVKKNTNIKKPKPPPKDKASSIVKNRERNAQISRIRKEIDDYKLNKFQKKEEFSTKSNKFFELIKNQKKDSVKLYYKPMNEIRLKNYNRTLNKCMSQVITNKKFKLPYVGLDINDVYSRLYHNEVYTDVKDPNRSTDNFSKTHSALINDTNLMQPQTSNNNNTTNNNNNNNHKGLYKSFSLKNVIKSTNGKEFTIKITDEIIRQCLIKYSFGPKSNFENMYNWEIKELNEEENILRMVKLRDEFGNTNLHNAVLKDSREFVRYFLEKNMDPNAQNNEGDTPLHLAMRLNDVEIIRMLLEANADITIRNKDRQRPYDIAKYPIKIKFKLEAKMMELKEPL